MEFFQRAQNPWGQEVLVRIAWDLFWAAVIVGVLFMIGHLIFRAAMKKRAHPASEEPSGAENIPEKIERHSLTARLFHWVMALAMLVLLFTGFLPQIGIQFSWVTIHWIAGIVLIACILFHIVHATFFQSLRNVWIGLKDIKGWFQEIRHVMNPERPAPEKPGKYPIDHKLYHHAVTLAGFGAMITGVLMMFKVENPFLAHDPYRYTDGTWGMIYTIHGLSGVALVTLTITHIYFAILPEKRWITLSMIFGWIGRREFLAHHSAERWTPKAAPEREGHTEPASQPAEAQ